MYHVYRLMVVLVFGFVFMQNSFALFKYKHKKILGCRYERDKQGRLVVVQHTHPSKRVLRPLERPAKKKRRIVERSGPARSTKKAEVKKPEKQKLENTYEYRGFVIYNDVRPAGMTKAKAKEYLNALNQLACAIGQKFLKECITDIRKKRFDPDDNEVLTGQLRSCGIIDENDFFPPGFVRMVRNETKFPGIDYHISN